jgi:hypothetical protein
MGVDVAIDMIILWTDDFGILLYFFPLFGSWPNCTLDAQKM